MSIELMGPPSLNLTYSTPNLKEDCLGVQSAKWKGRASVKVRDEQGKKWQIGFVQVLRKNKLNAIYTRNELHEVLKTGRSLPILDGRTERELRPFYGLLPDTKAEVNMAATAPAGTEQMVAIKMSDEPESQYKWWFRNDPTDPLVEFVMYLEFSTYVAAREVTDRDLRPMTMRYLWQWDVFLDRRYTFNVVRNGTSIPPIADLGLAATQCFVQNPSREPRILHCGTPQLPLDTLLSGERANGSFVDKEAPVGAIHIGASIQSMASRFGGTGGFRRTPGGSGGP